MVHVFPPSTQNIAKQSQVIALCQSFPNQEYDLTYFSLLDIKSANSICDQIRISLKFLEERNAKIIVSTQPLPAVCSCPLKTLACLPFPQLKSISPEPWCFVACHQQNQRSYSGISSLVCSIPRYGDLWLGIHWVFIWVSLMLRTPFREASEPGCKIMEFPRGQ